MPPQAAPLRRLALAIAIVGAFALALQLALSIAITRADGGGAWTGAWLYLGYFTISTNALATFALAANGSTGRSRLEGFFRRPTVLTALAGCIVIVGIVYNLLLRRLWHPQGITLLADVLLHDAMPLAFLLFWWLVPGKQALRWRGLAWWQLYPAAYFVYVLVRGACTGWYPYPFLDVSQEGYAEVLEHAVAMLVAFVGVEALLIGLGRWPRRRAAGATLPPAAR